MRSFALALLIVLSTLAAAMAAGQYYVPRAYFTIDDNGQETPLVPLRRLRRGAFHNALGAGARASASASADSESYGGGVRGGGSNARANAEASGSSGGYFPGFGGHHGGRGRGYAHPGLGSQ